MLQKLLLLAALCCGSNECYKILLIFPIASRSHYHLGSALAKGLADAGHNITIISPYAEQYKPKNGSYREIVLNGLVEAQNELKKGVDMFNFDAKSLKQVKTFMSYLEDIATSFFTHSNVQQLLKSNATFDATIVEYCWVDSLLALPAHFNSHQILLSPIASSSWVDHIVGNPSLPSHSPQIFLPFTSKMNFWQRLTNMLIEGMFKIFTRFLNLPFQDDILKKHLHNAADINAVMQNVSLVLLNSHPSLVDPQNRVPNMIDVAGFHLKSPKKLPKDLQDFLDNSKDGVVYFSLGSVLESKNMPVKTRNLILRTLGSLKENVLWKWEEDNLPGQPKNVRIEKWLPQESVLAHPNVKLFITHGGFLSTIETTYYGVPIVAIPIIADQKANAQNAELLGMGKYLPFQELENGKLTNLIKEVLSNPKYAQTAKQKSALMKDRQVPPLETAIFWVEYVIRHNGAKHLRVAALDLAWYQYYLLDVIGFLLALLVLGLYIIKKVFILFCCRWKKDYFKKDKLS